MEVKCKENTFWKVSWVFGFLNIAKQWQIEILVMDLH